MSVKRAVAIGLAATSLTALAPQAADWLPIGLSARGRPGVSHVEGFTLNKLNATTIQYTGAGKTLQFTGARGAGVSLLGIRGGKTPNFGLVGKVEVVDPQHAGGWTTRQIGRAGAAVVWFG